MTAFNVVRMRVKAGRNEDYLEAHRAIGSETFPGMKSVAIIQTGERDYCLIGEWDDMAAIVAARPKMIETLDRSREMLDDLGGGLGVTDPVSGKVVFEAHRPSSESGASGPVRAERDTEAERRRIDLSAE